MKLFINNQFQDAVEVDIVATAKVLDLKEIISARINGVTVPDQVLKYRSKTLINSETIQTAGINDNSVIELSMQKTFKIFVKMEDNRIHELDVHSLYNGEIVKKMLNRKLKIIVDKQRLLFNGKEIKDNELITERFINPGTTINLLVINLNLKLNIVQRSGQVERIEILKNASVGQLKEILFNKYKIQPHRQILKYNGDRLENDNKTLADYNIEDLSEINFRPNDMEILIQATSIGRERIPLRAFPSDTIGQVKDLISAETNINRNIQQLIWNGRALPDDAVLSYEHIHPGSTLIMVITVQELQLNIQIGPEDRVAIEVQSTETVAQLKAKLFNQTKIPPNQQILFLDNTKLADAKMIIDYGINESSDIAMERTDSFELHIESFTGRHITIRVHKTDTVDTIKTQIDRRLGVRPEHQRLLYFAQELKNETLESYRIEKQCTIHLVSRVPGGKEF